jgi:hypothetical protein
VASRHDLSNKKTEGKEIFQYKRKHFSAQGFQLDLAAAEGPVSFCLCLTSQLKVRGNGFCSQPFERVETSFQPVAAPMVSLSEYLQ